MDEIFSLAEGWALLHEYRPTSKHYVLEAIVRSGARYAGLLLVSLIVGVSAVASIRARS